jgi:cytochrome c553
MKLLLIGATLGLLAHAAHLARVPQDDVEEHAVTPAEAGRSFANACTRCHLPPDARYATDRAWLNQVRDTA